jgi:hypothetical protein
MITIVRQWIERRKIQRELNRRLRGNLPKDKYRHGLALTAAGLTEPVAAPQDGQRVRGAVRHPGPKRERSWWCVPPFMEQDKERR